MFSFLGSTSGIQLSRGFLAKEERKRLNILFDVERIYSHLERGECFRVGFWEYIDVDEKERFVWSWINHQGSVFAELFRQRLGWHVGVIYFINYSRVENTNLSSFLIDTSRRFKRNQIVRFRNRRKVQRWRIWVIRDFVLINTTWYAVYSSSYVSSMYLSLFRWLEWFPHYIINF